MIEIMAAVAILSLMIVFLANVFSNTSKVWKLGNKRVESNNSGRAAIEFVARELQSALTSRNLEMALASDVDQIYPAGLKSDRIAFVSSSTLPQAVTNPPGKQFLTRQIKQTVFAVITTNSGKGPYSLVMHNQPGPTDVQTAYSDPGAWCGGIMNNPSVNNSSVIADNVRNFEVWVYDQGGIPVPGYQSWINGPPLFIDVYLEVLAEEDAVRAAEGANQDEVLTRATRRYHTRVSMPNVQGAMRD